MVLSRCIRAHSACTRTTNNERQRTSNNSFDIVRQFIYFDIVFLFPPIFLSISNTKFSFNSSRLSNWMQSNRLHAFLLKTRSSLCVCVCLLLCIDIVNGSTCSVFRFKGDRMRAEHDMHPNDENWNEKKQQKIETVLFTAWRNHDKCTCEYVELSVFTVCIALSRNLSICRQVSLTHSRTRNRTGAQSAFIYRTENIFPYFSLRSKFIYSMRDRYTLIILIKRMKHKQIVHGESIRLAVVRRHLNLLVDTRAVPTFMFCEQSNDTEYNLTMTTNARLWIESVTFVNVRCLFFTLKRS